MTATTSAKKADGTVNLSFNHNLAKVTVTIESWSNEYTENEKVANALELNSLSSVISYDGTLSGDNTAKWIKAYVTQANTSFSAIIAPGTYEAENNIMQIYVNGSSKPLAVKTSSALTIESGKAYSFKLTVGKNLATITSSVTVEGWDDDTLEDQQATEVVTGKSEDPIPDNQIWYSTTDNAVMAFDVENAAIISNSYEEGKGVIVCDKEITYININDDCTRLSSLVIPNTVTSVGSFSGCTNLQKLTIPNSVKLYNYTGSFVDCTGELIVNCDIPSPGYSGETKGIFSGSKFSKVTIGDDVTLIGTRAFFGCNTIDCIQIGKGVKNIGYYAFYHCKGDLIFDCNIPDPVNTTYGGVFNGAEFSKVTIGKNVTSIGEKAFQDLKTLTEIAIPNNITDIKSHAFVGCENLKRVYIEDLHAWCSINFGGSYANPLSNGQASLYVNNEILTDLIIPENITVIKMFTFNECNTLKSVVIHSGVEEIQTNAFWYCSNLSNVYCKAVNPPKANNMSFDFGSSRLKIYVPEACVNEYKSANGWNFSADNIFADTSDN